MRRTGRILVGAVAVVSLAACGGTEWSQRSGAAKGAPVQLTSIFVNTTEAKTAKFDMHATVSGLGATGTTFDATGAIDLAHNNAEVSGDIGPAHIDERVVDGVVYVQMPFGDKWMRVDLGKLPGIGNSLGQLGAGDPTQVLSYLKQVATDVQEAGHESVRGVDTTHYTATIAQLPINVWVDGEGRLRKESVTVNRDGIDATVTIELYDFGAAVNVAPPPPDQVTSVDGLLGGLGKSLGLGG